MDLGPLVHGAWLLLLAPVAVLVILRWKLKKRFMTLAVSAILGIVFVLSVPQLRDQLESVMHMPGAVWARIGHLKTESQGGKASGARQRRLQGVHHRGEVSKGGAGDTARKHAKDSH